MTSGLTVALAVCLTMICLGCLTMTAFLVWWVMGSAGQHSTSAGRQQTLALESMKETVGQVAGLATTMVDLSETLLLGRPIQESQPRPESESPNETSPMPADLWQQLPDPIKQTLLREWDEAETMGIWPSPLETLQPDSEQVSEPI